MNEGETGLIVGLVLALTFGVAYAVSKVSREDITPLVEDKPLLLTTGGKIQVEKGGGPSDPEGSKYIKLVNNLGQDPEEEEWVYVPPIISNDIPDDPTTQKRIDDAIGTTSKIVNDDPSIVIPTDEYRTWREEGTAKAAIENDNAKAGAETTVVEVTTTGKISVENVMPKIEPELSTFMRR